MSGVIVSISLTRAQQGKMYMQNLAQADQIKELKGTLDAYKIALQHIANGHPEPAKFAKTLLEIK